MKHMIMPVKTKIRLTTSERIELFRPNVMLARLDQQEARFVQSAMVYVRQQTENLVIQLQLGKSPKQLILAPNPVRGLANALAASMIDTYALGQVSYQAEARQADLLHHLKAGGIEKPAVFAVDPDVGPFYPEAGNEWYANYTLRLAGVHSVDALENTKNAIAQGVENGLNQEQTISLIRQQFPDFSEHRLENIARTETAKIYEQSRYQQMVGDEEVVGYEYSAIMDSRTSDICRSRNGKIIAKANIEGWMPPAHYMCRSTILPVFAWEEGIQYTLPDTVTPALPGFGSAEMVIPETARNKIYIGGIPELRKPVENKKISKATAPKTKTIKNAVRFVPAKTKAEALLKLQKYADQVYLPDARLDDLNSIAEGLDRVLGSRNIKLQILAQYDQLGDNVYAAAYEDTHILINPDYLKKLPSERTAKELSSFTTRKARTINNLNDMLQRPDLSDTQIEEINHALTKMSEIVRFTSAMDAKDSVMASIMHESGHIIGYNTKVTERIVTQVTSRSGRTAERVTVKFDKALDKYDAVKDIHKVSQYSIPSSEIANGSASELFAEVTSLVNDGRSSLVPESILKAYNEVLGIGM